MISELVREKILNLTTEEVPHSVLVLPLIIKIKDILSISMSIL